MALSSQQTQEILSLVRLTFPDWDGFTHPPFVKEEITYKKDTIGKAANLLNEKELRRLIAEKDFDQFINRLDRLGKDNNLLYRSTPTTGDLNVLYDPKLDRPTFCAQVIDLLYGPGPSPERLQRYVDYVDAHELPNKWTFPTYFLFICHPDTEIFVKPVTTQGFLKLIGREDIFESKPNSKSYEGILDVGRELRDAFQEYGPHDMVDIQSLIWVSARADKKPTDQTGVRYWKIAPGKSAWQWDECRDGGFIAIGWEELGDIAHLTRAEFETKRDELIAEHDDWRAPVGPNQVWTFAHEIRQGDIIVANKGKTSVLGIGSVSGPYHFTPDMRFGHQLPVKWFDQRPRQVNELGWLKAIIELNEDQYQEILALPVDKTPGTNDRLAELRNLLKRKHQMILAGPPGTSKTYTAFQVIASMENDGYKPWQNPQESINACQFEGTTVQGSKVCWDVVQFHPSYGYEDFVTGIDAKTDPHGRLSFNREPRIFLRMALEAAAHPDRHYVLIIDEINRSILGRVFGELILTLEYRDLGVRLPGQDQRVCIPENLYLIGTMNTADRNIALVDYALRRRFLVVACLPSIETLEPYLESSEISEETRQHVPSLFWAVQQLFFATGNNSTDSDGRTDAELHGCYDPDTRGYNMAHYAVGHTYFMVEDLEELWINLRYQVIPLLEEYRNEGILTDERIRRAASLIHEALAGLDNNANVEWLRNWCAQST